MTAAKLRFRPVGEFLDAKAFSVPSGGLEGLRERSNTNLVYYQANYLVVVGFGLLWVCLSRPAFAVAVAASAASGYYVFAAMDGAAVVGGRVVSRRRVAQAWLGASLVLFLLVGRVAVLVALLVTLGLVVLHAAFRKRSLKARGANFVGGSTPLGMAFRSLDDVLDGSDDEEDVVVGGRGMDAENPTAGYRQQQQPQYPQHAAPAYPAYPAPMAGAAAGATAHHRANFREQMRAKYQRPA